MDKQKLKTILYVDDEPDIREVVEMSLGLAADIAVHTCDSGEKALQVLTSFEPDLILLDVMMPGLDGPSTLLKIRSMARFVGTPVIFMTAKALPAEVDRFRSLGAIAVIAKPFDPMQLANQVIAIWEGYAHV